MTTQTHTLDTIVAARSRSGIKTHAAIIEFDNGRAYEPMTSAVCGATISSTFDNVNAINCRSCLKSLNLLKCSQTGIVIER